MSTKATYTKECLDKIDLSKCAVATTVRVSRSLMLRSLPLQGYAPCAEMRSTLLVSLLEKSRRALTPSETLTDHLALSVTALVQRCYGQTKDAFVVLLESPTATDYERIVITA